LQTNLAANITTVVPLWQVHIAGSSLLTAPQGLAVLQVYDGRYTGGRTMKHSVILAVPVDHESAFLPPTLPATENF